MLRLWSAFASVADAAQALAASLAALAASLEEANGNLRGNLNLPAQPAALPDATTADEPKGRGKKSAA